MKDINRLIAFALIFLLVASMMTSIIGMERTPGDIRIQ